MSWSRRAARRSVAALALAAQALAPAATGAVALALGGCGFEPLYSEAVQQREDPQLAGIIVEPISDRYGQELELSLREALNPEGLAIKPRYRLKVTVSSVREDLGIQRDASSTRGRVDVYATLFLYELETGKQIYTSRAQSTSAFNILQDAYAAQVAEDDARTRTVRDLTTEIRTRLVLFLRDRPAAKQSG